MGASDQGVHHVPDRCGTAKRTRKIRVVKVVKINSPASGATAVTSTIAADANSLVANLARKTRRPRQEVTHLQRKRPLPRPSRVGLSRKQPAHRHLPSFTIVRFSFLSTRRNIKQDLSNKRFDFKIVTSLQHAFDQITDCLQNLCRLVFFFPLFLCDSYKTFWGNNKCFSKSVLSFYTKWFLKIKWNLISGQFDIFK